MRLEKENTFKEYERVYDSLQMWPLSMPFLTFLTLCASHQEIVLNSYPLEYGLA